MAMPQIYSIDELDRMSLTQLKDLAQSLDVVVSLTTPTRSKLLQQVKECLLDNHQITDRVTETEIDNEINYSDIELPPMREDDVPLDVLSMSEQLRLKIELAKIEAAKQERIAKIAADERIALARIHNENRTQPMRSQTTQGELANIELAKYQQYVPKFQNFDDAEDFFIMLEKNCYGL